MQAALRCASLIAPPNPRLVNHTEVGIEMKFKDMKYPVLIGATHVPELNAIEASGWTAADRVCALLSALPSAATMPACFAC